MMINKHSLLTIFIILLTSMLLLSACSNSNSSSTTGNGEIESPVVEEPEIDPYEALVMEKNEEIELTPLELTSYSEDVGATFANPSYQKFAVDGQVVVEGQIEKHAELQTDFVWIKVTTNVDGPTGKNLEYYTHIINGTFKQEIHFYNGEGEYQVNVQLPSMDRENYYYSTAKFDVINVNPEKKRDVTFTPYGYEAGLALDLSSSYVEENGVISLKGTANLTDEDTVMITLKKDSDNWKHVMPVKNGQFSYDVPLFFGEGLHELEVLVPDENRNNYYRTASVIYIHNLSNEVMMPITYYDMYIKRGVTLESPSYGGEKAEQTYFVRGTIDQSAEFAQETTHLYITTELDGETALEVIPVENFVFDGEFHLRFGPGTYKVTLSVPEIRERNSNEFRYFHFAEFEVESVAAVDNRNLLPSRGVQSDDPIIIALANEITEGASSDREKAKAVYEYVAKNISYDVEKLRTNDFQWDDSALKTLELKSGVCQDYAYLAIALLRAVDMEARYVEGFTRERHAWVEVLVDGDWLTMDPTWGAGYVHRNEFVAEYNETYFDPNTAEFEKTHKRNGVAY
ncbi:transglutaminase domain-containing protein [Sutcliffiella cohnii]|uniref:transglutaminase-like domain-containing protein n=1 Tax=Sutcliffiella cohnii TaxID=33932 RepID=UPI002E1A5E64|nr:transglutaminase domain-containing protein [Sutcliffiella cohnii]